MTTRPDYGLQPLPYHGLVSSAPSPVLEEQKPEISASDGLNAPSPSHRLPNELLVEVFLYVQTDNRSWPRLLVVCKRWRVAALMSARLWCRLDVGTRTPHARILASLNYSGSLPLDVAFNPRVRISAALKELTSHRNRIRSLRFLEARRAASKDILAFLQAPMPALQILCVGFKPYVDESYRFNPWSEMEDEPDEEAALCFAPAPNQFPALEELDLRAVELLAAPVAFPVLKSLRLADCIHTDPIDTSIPRHPSPRYHLPLTLHTLTLEDEEQWTHAYLDHLVLPPNLSKLSVTKHAVPDLPDEGLLSVQPISSCLPDSPDGSIRAILSDVESVRLDLEDSHNRLSVVGTAGTRTVSLAAVAWTRCFMEPNPVHAVVRLFKDAPVTDLQIFGVEDHDERNATKNHWGEMLWYLWSLRRLALTVESGARSVRDNLLSVLAEDLPLVRDEDEDEGEGGGEGEEGVNGGEEDTDEDEDEDNEAEEGDVPLSPLLSPDLEELRINAFGRGDDRLLDTLVKVLRHRQECGLRLSRLLIAISPPDSDSFPKIEYLSALAPLVDVVHCRAFGGWFADWNYTPPPSIITDATV